MDEQTQNIDDSKELLRELKKLSIENEELRSQLLEVKQPRQVHFKENVLLAEYEIRLIKVEERLNTLVDKLMSPSLNEPNKLILSTEGKRVKRNLRR